MQYNLHIKISIISKTEQSIIQIIYHELNGDDVIRIRKNGRNIE